MPSLRAFVKRLPSVLTYALVILALSLGILWLIPANYYMIFPGQAQQVAPMISVSGHAGSRSSGGLYDTYVDEFRATRLLYVLFGLVRSDVTVEPATLVSGGCPDSQYQQELLGMMVDSKLEAEAAALQALGRKVEYASKAPQIIQINPGVPAASELRPDDRIEAIDGVKIQGPDPVNLARNLILAHPAGSLLHMRILRSGKVIPVAVRTIRANDCGNPVSHGGHTLVGISMVQPLKFPVHLSIATGDVGGPSAGLAFALGIVQQLTRHDLTHGNKVAVTGTIQVVERRLRNGRLGLTSPVGAIGGARQKALAAQAAGAKYFLVPTANYAEAVSAHAHLKVIPVKTLSQALQVLSKLPKAK